MQPPPVSEWVRPAAQRLPRRRVPRSRDERTGEVMRCHALVTVRLHRDGRNRTRSPHGFRPDRSRSRAATCESRGHGRVGHRTVVHPRGVPGHRAGGVPAVCRSSHRRSLVRGGRRSGGWVARPWQADTPSAPAGTGSHVGSKVACRAIWPARSSPVRAGAPTVCADGPPACPARVPGPGDRRAGPDVARRSGRHGGQRGRRAPGTRPGAVSARRGSARRCRPAGACAASARRPGSRTSGRRRRRQR